MNIDTTHNRANVAVDEHVDNAVDKHYSYPSIHMIKKRKIYKGKFTFHEVSSTDIFDQVQKLNTEESSPRTSILAKIVKDHCDILA